MRAKTIIVFVLSLMAGVSFATEWEQRADFGSHGRHRGTAASVGTKGYMGLGHYNGAGPNIILDDWWEYDPATNAWTQKADHPVGNYGVIAFTVGDYCYVGSGQVNSNFYRFDPASNQWDQLNTPPTSFSNSHAFSLDGKAYSMPTSSSNLYEYDPISDNWTIKNNAPFSASFWATSFVIGEKAYVKNGSSLWEYKPSIDEWIARAPFPGLATSGSVALTQYEKGVLVSGYGSFLSNVTSEVWAYDPYLNEWDSLTEFPGNSRRFASGFSVGNRCYFGIGTNGTNFGDFWEFDALANVQTIDFEHLNVFPNPASEFVRFKLNSMLEFSVEIYATNGQLIRRLEAEGGFAQFNRENLLAGTYYYSIKKEGIVVQTDSFIFN